MTDERRAIDLEGVRADGWLERLVEGSAELRQLVELLGLRFVAFGLVAGVRVTALTLDRRAPDATLVDFVVGDEEAEQRLPLGEFRRRLAAALASDEEPAPTEFSPEMSRDELQAALGVRYVLLAPVFGVKLLTLHTGGALPASILIQVEEGAHEELTLPELRELLRDRVRAEAGRQRPREPFAIDLARVPLAEEALTQGDPARAIELLGAWPGPLSLLLRTAEGQQLAAESKAVLARALGVLGSAYVQKERYEWAEEILRLGIQWGQEGAAAAELFRRLGAAMIARERHGEAIGLLRRALALGDGPRDAMPLLARAFLSRGKAVAAMVCIEDALAAGAPEEEIAQVRADANAALGSGWTKLRAFVSEEKA